MFTHQMCSYPGAACIRQVLACAKTGCSATPTVLASFLRNPVGLATDGANVYFAERGVTANASDMSTGPMISPFRLMEGATPKDLLVRVSLELRGPGSRRATWM
jgi:hypothetical protein